MSIIILFANNLQLTQVHTMVTQIKKKSKQILKYAKYFKNQNFGISQFVLKSNYFLSDFSWVLNRPQKSQNFSRPTHLGIDIKSSTFLSVVNRVESQVLDKSQYLYLGYSTVSLLDVLESNPRKVFRYYITNWLKIYKGYYNYQLLWMKTPRFRISPSCHWPL